MRFLAPFFTAILFLLLGANPDPAWAQPVGAPDAQNPSAQAQSTTAATAPMQQAPAAPAAAVVPPPAETAGANLDQVVCREMPAKTGSRLGGGRECHTQREWNRIRQDSQDITRRQQMMGYSTGGR